MFRIKYNIIFLLLIFGATSLSASTSPKDNNTLSLNTLHSQTIELVQSGKLIEIATQTGISLLLPKYDMHIVEIPLSIAHNIIEEQLTEPEDLALNKEMEDLSKKLGIKIEETENLNLYREVASWLGTRYRRGGMSRKAVDCSGFTNIIYNTVYNKKLPRVSTTIATRVTESLSIDKLLPGDLVFFSTLGKKRINHVGVYLGEGCFAHASIKGGVKVSPLTEGYYKRTLKKAGRID